MSSDFTLSNMNISTIVNVHDSMHNKTNAKQAAREITDQERLVV